MIGSPHNYWIISTQWLDHHTTIGSFPHNDKIFDPSLSDKGPVLEEGSIRRALKGALQTFNIQVQGIESLDLYDKTLKFFQGRR